MLVAGRCLNADSTAAGAVRVMPPCMAMGQAAGIAAALSIKENIVPRKLAPQIVQSKLAEKGVDFK